MSATHNPRLAALALGTAILSLTSINASAGEPPRHASHPPHDHEHQPSEEDDHEGRHPPHHDHDQDHTRDHRMAHNENGTGHHMPSPIGPWTMARDASGTSWQPDASHHGGLHWQNGDWSFMSHTLLNLSYSRQNGPRGDQQVFASGMIMGSARRELSQETTLNLRAMLSPDPSMGREGYPLLLAAGETADGVTPLVDRQHPHELIMELSASLSRRLGENSSAYLYAGLPGEPAFGPPAFMHRMSAMDSPEAPITHHWLDSTHIVFGVITAGYAWRNFKFEASAFRGREPDQNRLDIESPRLDSAALRLSWLPNSEWAVQVSWADITAPEQLHPDDDERRWSASAIHTRNLGSGGWWSSTIAFGRRIDDHGESKDAWLLETALAPDNRWTLFARAESIESDELMPGHGGHHGDVYRVSKISFGAIHDWSIGRQTRLGLGALYAINTLPDALAMFYGRSDPRGMMIFLRLRID
jgi:hypothetical protein